MPDTLPKAQLPTSASALLYAVSLFCPPKWQHTERRRYANSEMRLENWADRSVELLDMLCEALGQKDARSPTLWLDFLKPVSEGLCILDSLELHTRTYSATPQQALWVLLAFDIMPYLGRTWGFWCQDEAVLPRMPEDDLWFLPHQDPADTSRLILPVEAILTWWLEQIEGPLDRLWGGYDDERKRSFYNWKSGRRTPETAKIMEWFGEDNQFSYKNSKEVHLSTSQLRSLLIWARALEQGYKDLVGFLTPDVAPTETDPMRNKALQLVELFRWSHETTVSAEPNNPSLADQAFVAALPSWLKEGPFRVITPNHAGELMVTERAADFLSEIFRSIPLGEALPNIFEDLTLRSPAPIVKNDALSEQRWTVEKAIESVLTAWMDNDAGRHIHVVAGLAKLGKLPGIAEFEPDLSCLYALHTISSGEFDEAREHAEKALDLCMARSIGPLKLFIAKLNFSLAVAQNAFNRNSAERSFRILCKSIHPQEAARWGIGEGPIDYSMRLAAAEHAASFWRDVVRPYEGVEIEAPLEQNSEVFCAYADLLWSGASENEVRGFIKQFRGTLKRRLRNVRGDTFFTATSKMVADIVSVMRKIRTDSGISIDPSELAKSMKATHLKLVSILPTDVLNAQDYLKQTALMLAADSNDLDMAQALIDRHVDIDAQDALGRTALHSAAKVGADQCFEVLLAAGANPTFQTFSGMTPAIFAAEFGRATIFEMRLACKAYKMGRSELEAAHQLAQDSADNFKEKRKAYAIQGYKVAGRKGFQRIAALTQEILNEDL